MSAPATTSSGTSAGAIVAAVVALAGSALLFLLIWFAIPNDHNLALGTIGIVSLVFALVCTFSRAFTRAGGALQTLSWGYAGLGFVLLIGSLVLAGPAIGIVWELAGLIVVLVLMGITGALAVWGAGSMRMTQQREARREAWRETTPRSAFDYTTARPNVPAANPPPPEGNPPTPPPGVSR